MKTYEILLTTLHGQELAGTVSWDGTSLHTVPAPEHEVLMANLKTDKHYLVGTDEYVTAESDPARWFESISTHLTGSYLRARLVTQPQTAA